MKVYAVRQKSTGLFIPRLETGQRRGGSHLEPSADRSPRVFHSKGAARAFLGAWLRGVYKRTVDFSGDWEHHEDYVDVVAQPHRKKEDMEIVEFLCVEEHEDDTNNR